MKAWSCKERKRALLANKSKSKEQRQRRKTPKDVRCHVFRVDVVLSVGELTRLHERVVLSRARLHGQAQRLDPAACRVPTEGDQGKRVAAGEGRASREVARARELSLQQVAQPVARAVRGKTRRWVRFRHRGLVVRDGTTQTQRVGAVCVWREREVKEKLRANPRKHSVFETCDQIINKKTRENEKRDVFENFTKNAPPPPRL